ncbi:Protein of unknown function [Lactobacillus delbrueckii subsp. bulgaricus]|nr:Protein of unknown function [Lactobacillus delbrueckii subsp. bulgaricus]
MLDKSKAASRKK